MNDPLNVLCVDDVLSNAVIIKKIIESADDVAHVVTSPLEAQKLLSEKKFDLVVTDQEMPEMCGIDLIRWIKEHRPSTEVIVVTAHSSISLAVQSIKAGASNYIEKPIDAPLLKEKVHDIRRRLSQAESFKEREKALEDANQEALENLRELQMSLAQHQKFAKEVKKALKIEEQGEAFDSIRAALKELKG